MDDKRQIAIVGPGNIGKATGLAMIQHGLGDVVFWGRDEDKLRGTKLELMSCVDGDEDFDVCVSTNPAIIAGSDVVVVTSGKPRTGNMTRADLIKENAPIIEKVGAVIAQHAPDALVILVTNPLDAMVELMNRTSGLPENKIIGMAGILDSRRFRGLLAEELGVRPHEVEGIVIGQHSDSMVPLFSSATLRGRRLDDLVAAGKMSRERLDGVKTNVASTGATILRLNGMTAYLSPAACATDIAESYLTGKAREFPASVRPRGVYGLDGDISIGVPVIVNEEGVTPFEIPLSPDEKAAFERSVADQVKQNQALDEFLSWRSLSLEDVPGEEPPFQPA